MLVHFSVENYLSFKSRAVINFQAGTIKEYRENVFIPFLSQNAGFLKSVGIFGPNAGGKSNVIKAISFMRDFVLNSSKESQSIRDISIQPFRLSVGSEFLPSTFEVVFFLDTVKYRYGFSVSTKLVDSEWLFITVKKKEELIFLRTKGNYSVDKKFKNEIRGKFELFEEITRNNSLFLSVLAQFNNPLCLEISKWFSNILIAHDVDHMALIDFTAKLLSMGDYRKWINDIVKKSDLGIESVEERIKDISSKKNYSIEFLSSVFKDEIKDYTIRTTHMKYSKEETPLERVYFDLLEDESLGTQKFFGILGPILYSLKTKAILWIDEIDARMHTKLTENIISLFNSKKYNPNGAQLIFTSHNTNLLKKGLRRDQMYFIEKNERGVSELDSLYNKDPQIRNDATFDKDYLVGKYGAIPNLGSQLNIFDIP
jgi:AAA15 family ATPase/GTPase